MVADGGLCPTGLQKFNLKRSSVLLVSSRVFSLETRFLLPPSQESYITVT